MDLPEVEELMAQIENEDKAIYSVLTEETINAIYEVEKVILDN